MAGFEPTQDVPKTPMLTINITSRYLNRKLEKTVGTTKILNKLELNNVSIINNPRELFIAFLVFLNGFRG